MIHMSEQKDHGLKYNASRYYDPTAYEALKNIESEENNMQIFRGDIYYVKKRFDTDTQEAPAIVVSNNITNNTNQSVTVVWLSQHPEQDAPTHVSVVCRTLSTAMCEKVSTVNKNRIGNLIRSCTDEEMQQIDNALALALGLGLIDCAPLPDDIAAEINKLKADLTEANAIIDEMTIELHKQSCPTPELDSIKVTAERDLYKRLYEQLLEQLTQKVG